MRVLRKSVAWAAESLANALVRLLFKLRRYGCLQVAGLEFHGPPFFLELCKEAVNELAKDDATLLTALGEGGYIFWYDPRKTEFFSTRFSIGGAYCAWRHLGIVALLVYAHNKAAAFNGRFFQLSQREEANALEDDVRRVTREWLWRNSFPEPLIECFRSRPT